MLRLLTWLLGPIFAKEMVELSRRKRYYFNRVLFGGVLLITLFALWEDGSYRFRWGGSGMIQAMAAMAEETQIAVNVVQYCAVYFFVPIFLCGVIASEREEKTLDLLFTTALADREIVLGKLASRLAIVVLLSLSALPVLSIFMMFGGIDPGSLWRTQAATLLAMIFAGSHAIYFSAVSRTPMGALVRTIWWIGLELAAVPLGMIMIEVGVTNRPPMFSLSVLAFANPVVQFIGAFDGFFRQQIVVYLGDWYFPLTFVVPGAWSVALLWLAVRRVRIELRPRGLRFAKMRRMGAWLHDGVTWPGRRLVALVCAFAGALLPARRDSEHGPFWNRARQALVWDRDRHIARVQTGGWLLAIGFLILMACVDPKDLDDDECAMIFLVPTWLGVALFATIVSATGLVGDRRRGFLELVLTTPLEPRDFIDGAMLSVWEHLRRIAWLPVALTAFFWLIGAISLSGAAASLVTGFLSCCLVVEFGTICSITARSVANALVLTLAFPMVTSVGTGLLIGLCQQAHGPVLWVMAGVALAGTSWWTRRSSNAAAVGCHLIAMHLAIASVATCWTFSGRQDELPAALMNPGFLTIAPLERNATVRIHGSQVSNLVVTLPYWAAAIATFIWARRWAIHRFDRLVGRVLAGPDICNSMTLPATSP